MTAPIDVSLIHIWGGLHLEKQITMEKQIKSTTEPGFCPGSVCDQGCWKPSYREWNRNSVSCTNNSKLSNVSTSHSLNITASREN